MEMTGIYLEEDEHDLFEGINPALAWILNGGKIMVKCHFNQ
jgi:hypothetical protein